MAKGWKKVDVKLGKDGTVLGTVVSNSKGDKKTLLNPHGKYVKYSAELANDKRYTNDGKTKTDEKGKTQKLTAKQKAFRAGYRSAVIDSTKAYKGGKK